MLRRFSYLDTDALGDYLSAMEGGVRGSLTRRTTATGKGQGGVDAKVLKAGGERSSEHEESFTLDESDTARFDRLIRLAEADPENAGWIEVMDADSDLDGVGVGAILSLECDIYVPDVVKALSSGQEVTRALDMMEAMRPLAEAFGQDLSTLPTQDQAGALRAIAPHMDAGPVIVGEIEDSEIRIASQLAANFVRGELEGPVRTVGKVTRQWPRGKWKPLLALPGSSLLPRDKRRELERTPPDPSSPHTHLEGPALMLDTLAIYR